MEILKEEVGLRFTILRFDRPQLANIIIVAWGDDLVAVTPKTPKTLDFYLAMVLVLSGVNPSNISEKVGGWGFGVWR
jgi:hypothetical protein